ncbi:DUF3221 domain-containing protein [Pontibacillus yanchengensis]|uniref:DUF3221 domain-containing protein n=2 Tax=Pontibacillus yanchengensis TaxID=462910 RepID=A0ACC7VED0_9BACI|nr:DUF3221 domain-containing protein [Pontibacillus yanchengensis]MYL35072.1 DUF3221 domain-containing protein [Pontibacillus yanchengensis]MYL52561.1 DUF3221 domain-containing protein [Pontibacillus yanchengensis]
MFFSILVVAGCSKEYTSEPTIVGYIVETTPDEQEILVVNQISKEQAMDFELEQYIGKGIDAYYINVDKVWDFTFDYEVGQKVRIWVDGLVDDSFPMQVELGKIEMIEE